MSSDSARKRFPRRVWIYVIFMDAVSSMLLPIMSLNSYPPL